MAGPIRIAILANAAQAKREMNSISKTTSSLGQKFAKFGKAAAVGVAVAGAAVVKFGASAVKSASDAQQSIGATETVFGKFSKSVIKTSDAAASKYGLSANVYRENANLLGSLFKGQGVALDQLGGKTESMIGTAADLAATFGGTTSDAVAALSSAFKGEFDPIERYGISIKQSDVTARLAAKGQSKLTGAAKKQAEQVAKTELIMQGAKQTNGAFAKESNTLAHQQQVLAARFENLKAKIGAALLPVITKVVGFVSDKALPAFEKWGKVLATKLSPYVDKAKTAFGTLMEKVRPIGDWFSDHPEVIKGVAIGLGLAAAAAVLFAAGMGLVALATSPITLVVLAVAALAGGIAYAYKNSETFRSALDKVGQIAMQVFGWMKTNVLPILQAIGQYYVAVFNALKNVTQTALSVIKSLWKTFGGTVKNFVKNTFNNIKTIVEGALKVVKGIIKVVTSAISGDWKGVWNGIKTILSGVWGIIKGIVKQGINVAKSAISVGWQAAKSLTSKAWEAMKTAVSNAITGIMNFVKGIPGKITGALGDLGSLLYEAGKDVIRGLINGITSMLQSAKDAVGGVVDGAVSWGKKKLGISSPSKVFKVIGIQTMQGLVIGLQRGSVKVNRTISHVVKGMRKELDKRYDGKALKAHSKRARKSLRNEFKAIRKNERAQNRVNKRLAQTNKLLAERVKASKKYAASVKASVLGTGNITSLGTGHMNNPQFLIDQLKQRVADAKKFAALIKSLTKSGLNKTTLQQLISAGVEGGMSAASALAAGGKEAVSEVNSLTKELIATGASMGNATAKTMHGAGIQAAQGLIRGLTKQGKHLDRAARRLARRLVKAVKKALGIKSPSKVFAGIGDNVTKGLVIGLDEYRVKKAGQALAGSLTNGFGTPALDAYSTSVSSSNESKVRVTLTADQVSQLQRGREIQMDLDAYKSAGGRAKAS